MKKRVQAGLVFVCIIFITGCAPKVYIPLAEPYKGKTISSDFVVVKSQKTIAAEIERSNVATATGGGIIPALIDMAVESSRSSDADDLLLPIIIALRGYKMEEVFMQELIPVLNNTPWFTKNSIKLSENKEGQVLDQHIYSTSADAVGIIKPYYRVNPDFSALRVKVEFAIYPVLESTKNEDNTGSQNTEPIYKTVAEHLAYLPAASDDEETNSILWAKNDGQNIRQAFQDCISVVVSQLKEDLQNPSREKKD